jgi:hypothetical protein
MCYNIDKYLLIGSFLDKFKNKCWIWLNGNAAFGIKVFLDVGKFGEVLLGGDGGMS